MALSISGDGAKFDGTGADWFLLIIELRTIAEDTFLTFVNAEWPARQRMFSIPRSPNLAELIVCVGAHHGTRSTNRGNYEMAVALPRHHTQARTCEQTRTKKLAHSSLVIVPLWSGSMILNKRRLDKRQELIRKTSRDTEAGTVRSSSHISKKVLWQPSVFGRAGPSVSRGRGRELLGVQFLSADAEVDRL
eukprot:COSAG01_NODE_1395_length_10476_cov_11.562331_8_plen_191_part_00